MYVSYNLYVSMSLYETQTSGFSLFKSKCVKVQYKSCPIVTFFRAENSKNPLGYDIFSIIKLALVGIIFDRRLNNPLMLHVSITAKIFKQPLSLYVTSRTSYLSRVV